MKSCAYTAEWPQPRSVCGGRAPHALLQELPYRVSPQPNDHNITTVEVVWELLGKTAIQAQTLKANSENHFCLGPEAMDTSWMLGNFSEILGGFAHLSCYWNRLLRQTVVSPALYVFEMWLESEQPTLMRLALNRRLDQMTSRGPFQPKLSYNSVKCWKITARSKKVEQTLTSSDARSRTPRSFLERVKKLHQNSHSISDCNHIGHAAVGKLHNLLPESWTEPLLPHFYQTEVVSLSSWESSFKSLFHKYRCVHKLLKTSLTTIQNTEIWRLKEYF